MNNVEWSKLDYAVHPGEILNDYLESENISQLKLSKIVGINKTIINEIIKGKRPITTRTAIKLEKAFSFNAQFWCNLQMIYDEAVERLKLQNEELSSNVKAYSYTAENDNSLIEKSYASMTSINKQFITLPTAA